MQINISSGEALDRLSILEIKEQNITDQVKLAHIKTEKSEYAAIAPIKQTYSLLYQLLVLVNTQIWNATNSIKTMSPSDSGYADLANCIFEWNQHRFRLKYHTNCLTSAKIQEQKSYKETSLNVVFKKGDSIVDLIYCYLHYDHLTVETMEPLSLFALLNISVIEPTGQAIAMPQIDRNSNYYKALEHVFRPIRYVSCGMLGDFIHQLSIVNENYQNTGRKGIIYISEFAEHFRFGLEKAFRDLLPLLTSFDYVESFSIHRGEPVDIDISTWRGSPQLYRTHWYNIFKNEYNIDFGKHAWMTSKCQRPDFTGKTVISTSMNRWGTNNYKNLASFIDVSNAIFVSFDNPSHIYFMDKTKINIPVYICSTLSEIVDIINSCDTFVGNLSAPLAIAFSLHKKSLIILSEGCDNNHFIGLNTHLPFLQFVN